MTRLSPPKFLRSIRLPALFAIVFLFQTLALAREVEFSWDPMLGAVKYELQVSRSENFDKLLTQTQTDTPTYSAQFGVGRYYFRVRVIDKKSNPGKWTKPEPLVIAPYSPAPALPQTGYEITYYEVLPALSFSWHEVEGKPQYEIMISKANGEKLSETTSPALEYKTNKLSDGEYTWKIRTVYPGNLVSEYSEARQFKITKLALSAPILVNPANEGLSSAYRPLEFKWTQDPHSHFTDFYFEKTKGRDASKLFKKKIPNLAGSTYTAPYEEPGEYKWSVTTKEAKDTSGVTSDFSNFEVRDDVLLGGDYELEFSLSPVGDLYTTNSSIQTGGNSFKSQQSTSSGIFTGFSAGYYIFSSLGVFASTRTASLGVENLTGYEQETDVNLRLRFGSKGFYQEFWYGYRIMDLLEPENTPSQQVTDFTTMGPLIGSRVGVTFAPGWKGVGTLFYYKPLSNVEGISTLTADVYGGSIGLKYNFLYQFWIGYKFAIERINASYVPAGAQPGINSGWTQYRTEPLYFSLSFEH